MRRFKNSFSALIAKREYCTKQSLRCGSDIRNKNFNHYFRGLNNPVCCNTHLFLMLKDLNNVFNRNNINYFVCYGSLIGIMRHKGFIPWDTDVDIVVFEKDRQEIHHILEASDISKKYNLDLSAEGISRINYSNINLVHIDLYYWKDYKDNFIDHNNKVMYYEDVFPIKQKVVYDISVNVPFSNKVLNEYYGKNYMTQGFNKYSPDHEVGCLTLPAQIDINTYNK